MPICGASPRAIASRSGDDAAILIGSSRIQTGIDRDAFVEASGFDEAVQLSIPMGPALPVLRDLASDPTVSGTIIYGAHPQLLFDMTRQLDRIPLRYLRRRAEFTPADVVETHLRALTQSTLTSSLPALFPRQLIDAWRSGRWPEPDFVSIDFERFGRANFRIFHRLALRRALRRAQWKTWLGRPASDDELAEMTHELNELVARVRDHGGDVVFIRMPTSNEVHAREQRLFPKDRYWDFLAEHVGAVMIHFAEHAALRDFRSPDGSHLDQIDAPAFSRALGKLVARELKGRSK